MPGGNQSISQEIIPQENHIFKPAHPHLLFECTAASVVEMREEVGGVVEKKVSRLIKPGSVGEATMVSWRLGSAGRPPKLMWR